MLAACLFLCCGRSLGLFRKKSRHFVVIFMTAGDPQYGLWLIIQEPITNIIARTSTLIYAYNKAGFIGSSFNKQSYLATSSRSCCYRGRRLRYEREGHLKRSLTRKVNQFVKESRRNSQRPDRYIQLEGTRTVVLTSLYL